MVPEIVPAKAEHIAAIAANVRAADRAELWASSCSAPGDVLKRGLSVSAKTWTGMIDGVPVCMFGVAPASVMAGAGRPWMVGTDMLDRYPRTFLRRCRPMVYEMLDMFPYLENYVDFRNTRAIEWLRWLGFSFSEPELIGPFRLPFLRFYMMRQEEDDV